MRVKHGRGIGGKGQAVATDSGTLAQALDAFDQVELATCGVVLEPSLEEQATYSVGQVSVDGLSASYCGTQRSTTDNGGRPAYGGSDLLIVRGGFAALLALQLDTAMRLAVHRALTFDQASAEFQGLFASRRNYDVLHGRDAPGRWHCGVLEQSWRIGGASGPEVAALEAFRGDLAAARGARTLDRAVRRQATAAARRDRLFPRRRPGRRAAAEVHDGGAERGGRPETRTESLAIPVNGQDIEGTLIAPAVWSRARPARCWCTAGAAARTSTSPARAPSPRWAAPA